MNTSYLLCIDSPDSLPAPVHILKVGDEKGVTGNLPFYYDPTNASVLLLYSSLFEAILINISPRKDRSAKKIKGTNAIVYAGISSSPVNTNLLLNPTPPTLLGNFFFGHELYRKGDNCRLNTTAVDEPQDKKRSKN